VAGLGLGTSGQYFGTMEANLSGNLDKMVKEFIVRQAVAPDLKTAKISVKGSIESFSESHEEVTVELHSSTGLLLQSHVLKAVQGIFQVTLFLEEPELW
jgi:beta-galactosidase/beta-glucuronidase